MSIKQSSMDYVEAFSGDSIYEIKDDINEWLEDNPEYYLDRMEMVSTSAGYKSVLCDFVRKDAEPEDEVKTEDEAKTEDEEVPIRELLIGVIGAINELTDAVKEKNNDKSFLQ